MVHVKPLVKPSFSWAYSWREEEIRTDTCFKNSYSFPHSYRKPYNTRSRHAFRRQRISTPWTTESLRVMRLEQGRPTYRYGPEEDGFLYVLGATVRKWLTYIGGSTSCNELLCEDPPTDSFIYERKYTDDPTLQPFKSPFNVHFCCWRYCSTQHNNALAWTPCVTHVLQNCYQSTQSTSISGDTHRYFFFFVFEKWVSTSTRIF